MAGSKVTTTCRFCNNTFEHWPSAKRKYCSRACSLEAHSGTGSYHYTPITDRVWRRVAKTEDPNECWMWTGPTDKDGYGKIRDSNRGKRRFFRAHSVALESATGVPRPDGMLVLHSCDNPGCCNPKHLRYGTAKENAADCFGRGRAHDRRGEKCPTSKLTVADVQKIKLRILSGEWYKHIAEDYPVSSGTIGHIARNERWAVVKWPNSGNTPAGTPPPRRRRSRNS